jgi:anti-anti-sigma factor
MAEALRVLIIDDHAAVREALASEFGPEPDFEIVGEAGSLEEAREMLLGLDLDVVILDLGLPDGSGVDLIPELLATSPDARAIVLSASYDPTLATQAIERGAAAVLDKVTHLGQVAQATRRVLVDRRRAAAPRDGSARLDRAETNAPSVLGRGLRILVSQVGASTTIRLEGEWDLAAREATRRAINKELVSRPERLVLDLSRLRFIDSSGIHIAIDLQQRAAQMNVPLWIVPGPKAVQRVFEICDLTHRLPFNNATA